MPPVRSSGRVAAPSGGTAPHVPSVPQVDPAGQQRTSPPSSKSHRPTVPALAIGAPIVGCDLLGGGREVEDADLVDPASYTDGEGRSGRRRERNPRAGPEMRAVQIHRDPGGAERDGDVMPAPVM
jgi:hypothetical protein